MRIDGHIPGARLPTAGALTASIAEHLAMAATDYAPPLFFLHARVQRIGVCCSRRLRTNAKVAQPSASLALEIELLTRESPRFPDRAIPLAITSIFENVMLCLSATAQ